MAQLPPCYGIIPARYASSRFPGKPLAEILGRPMFWHVHTRASRCPDLKTVVLATDDDRILLAAEALGVPALLTRVDHLSGSDRVLEAAEALGVPQTAVVVNIQGDEPALDPAMLSALVAPFADPDVRVTTLAAPIPAEAARQTDRVKVVTAADGRALYFSRAPIPWVREGGGGRWMGHIGLYAFRMETLRRFSALPEGDLERAEKLEQLRLLENGIPIHVVPTEYAGLGVDRPEDIGAVIPLLKAEPEPET